MLTPFMYTVFELDEAADKKLTSQSVLIPYGMVTAPLPTAQLPK